MHAPIPLLCDRCRAEGAAGEDPFAAYADLLEFEPVPRRPRADGWDAEVQRAFIAALAATGSPRQACQAVGKAQFGADQLKTAKGNESFMAAWARAMAVFAETRSRRLAEGVEAVTAAASPRPPKPAWGHAASRRPATALPAGAEMLGEDEEKVRSELLQIIVHKYLLKLGEERRCRLAGRIAEADFYLRQVTMLEVSMDVMSGDGMALLRDARLGGCDLLAIAETEMSKLLDEARRQHWAECGEPPRPEYPPRHLLDEREGGFATEPLETTPGGLPESQNEQWRKFDEMHARDAADHIAWEAEARRDAEARQAKARRGEAPPDTSESRARPASLRPKGRQD